MMHYLIAGAAGYVGSRLAMQLLDAGQRVRGLVRNPDAEIVEQLAARGMVVWTGDLTRPETLVGVADGIDVIYNLTSCLVLENGAQQRLYVDGNRHLIAAASRAHTVRRYIFASHIAPYGDGGDTLLDEDSPVAPFYPLGHILVEAEQTIMQLVQRHNFPAIILRVGTIYGPERDIIEAVRSGTAALALIGDGRNYTARIHIDDLLTVLQRVAIDGQPGALYNVADDTPLRAAELYGEVRRRLQMVPPRTHDAQLALQVGIDPNIVGMSAASVRINNARMKHDLGIELRYPSVLHWLDQQPGVQELVTEA